MESAIREALCANQAAKPSVGAIPRGFSGRVDADNGIERAYLKENQKCGQDKQIRFQFVQELFFPVVRRKCLVRRACVLMRCTHCPPVL